MSAYSLRWAFALTFAACSNEPERAIEKPEAADYSAPIVLFISPDSVEVDQLHRELGDEAFHVTADDAMWYRASAIEFLDSMNVPHAEVQRGAARFLVDGRPRLISWAEVDRPWFALVYDGEDEPGIFFDLEIRERLTELLNKPG